MSDQHTSVNWDEMTAPLVRAGDRRVLLSGNPPILDCRVLAEPHFQHAKKCVNAHDDMLTLLREWVRGKYDGIGPIQDRLDARTMTLLAKLDGDGK